MAANFVMRFGASVSSVVEHEIRADFGRASHHINICSESLENTRLFAVLHAL